MKWAGYSHIIQQSYSNRKNSTKIADWFGKQGINMLIMKGLALRKYYH